jgi:hypothetical protein
VHQFIEIKASDKAKYTPDQVRFQRVHPHAVIRCESTDQAVAICAQIRKRAGV